MSLVPENTVVDGRYRMLHKIGSGGMADVYCAEDTHLGRRIAMKLLHRRFAQDTEFVERFRREASSAAGLQHPNVVGVYDRGEFEDTYYIAMEYCEGRSLKDVIRAEAPLDVRRAIGITKQILLAARFAHRRNVIHRDLKPHNVLLDAEDGVKVTDFGIARAGASDITQAGAIMGTAQYLSPEQAQGSPVTEASDVYSIGVVLYELLTGKAPFEGESAVAIALMHVNKPAPSPRELVPAIPRELEAVVLKALAKTAAERYPDAESFMRDLEAVESRLDRGPVDTESTAVFAPVAVGMPPASTPPPPPPVAAAPPAGADGPAVVEPMLDLPPPPPPGEPPDEHDARRNRWLLPALLVAVAALAVVAFLALRSPSQVSVPIVVGQTLDSARAELERAGLEVDVRRRADRAPRDIVFDQAPNAGRNVDDGSSVAVFVSNGPGTVKVPDLLGLTEADAKRRLRAAGLTPEVQRESSAKVASGLVIRTDPSEGRPVDRRSEVTLFVSSGPEQVVVPDVTGQDETSAVTALRGKGLSAVVREKASTEPQGTVVSQSPAGGLQVDQGTSVTIFVSNGKVLEVPDVTGLSQADAESQLEDAGFRPSVRTRQTELPEEEGTVLSQSPRGGAERREGSTVTLTVGELVTPPPEPPAVP
jgi:beta-lactam-binding protein with PASTA domain/tRNA A-37 threonylcarbamoyl transferase component Bud32